MVSADLERGEQRAEVSERRVITVVTSDLRVRESEDGPTVSLCLGAGHRKRPGSEVRLLSPCWLWSQETH